MTQDRDLPPSYEQALSLSPPPYAAAEPSAPPLNILSSDDDQILNEFHKNEDGKIAMSSF